MQKLNISFKIIFILFLFETINISAQSLSTGTPVLEDYYRREQLLGNINPNFSFVSYPLFPVEAFGRKNPFDPDSTLSIPDSRNYDKALFFKKFDGTFTLANGKYIFKLLPVVLTQQYNSHHPEGLNDGSLIPARGYQQRLSAGFYFKSDHLSIKIQPEFVHADNPKYDGFPLTRKEQAWADRRWREYYDFYLNYIDAPERFGDKCSVYSKVYWGQSSIRITLNSISLGFSTENLWWGPGMRNSLLMTNSSSGFAHFTLNTVKPIETGIGSFEGQIIAGWLRSSGYFPPEHERNYNGSAPFYRPKEPSSRYLNAAILSYQPKWIPGLHLGLIRSFQVYLQDIGENFTDYLPIFTAFGLEAAGGEADVKEKKQDVYNSIFFRFVWPESHVEVYGEYGRSDYFWDKRDLIIQMEHSSAYNFGFRKLITLNNSKHDYFQVAMEITQLAKNANTILRNGRSWESSGVVRDGYTNNGQFLGAGIGPGSNLQTLNISWIRGFKMIGLQFERYVHNNDFFFERVFDIRSHWVDISPALIINWSYKNLLFNLTLKEVISMNYQWEYDQSDIVYWTPGENVYNFHGQLGIIYRF